MSPDPAILIDGLHKKFGAFPALNGVDLTVERGHVHGFLGPNGAGKSTTIRVLLGLLKADAGTATVLGRDPWRDVVALHQQIAYVPGDVSLWPSMTGGEAIDLLASLRGEAADLPEHRRRRDELIERFELDPTKRGRQYSKGNRQKVAIVAALSSDAELLILDEPTSGLDPLMENVFQEVIAEAKDRGITVLLSSHIMSEVEALADKVSIIRDGRILTTGTLAELRGSTRSIIRAEFTSPPDLSGIRNLHDLRLTANRLTASVESDHIGEVMKGLAPFGFTALTVEPPSLESMFLSLYDAQLTPSPTSREMGR